MSEATETQPPAETINGINVKKVRELANSDRDTAWIYQKWLDHYTDDADTGGSSK